MSARCVESMRAVLAGRTSRLVELRSVCICAALTLIAACASNEPRPDDGAVEAAEPFEAVEAAETAEAAEEAEARAAAEAAKAVQIDAAAAGEPVSEDAMLGFERALGLMSAGDWIEAELALEQFVLEHPGFPGAFVNLAIVHLRDGRREDAREALDVALAIDPGFAPANNELGVLLREAGEFDAAEVAYRTALERDPGYMLAHYNLAILLDLYQRRGVEALQHYETYQQSLAEPDQAVERWIVDLRRRLRASGEVVAADE